MYNAMYSSQMRFLNSQPSSIKLYNVPAINWRNPTSLGKRRVPYDCFPPVLFLHLCNYTKCTMYLPSIAENLQVLVRADYVCFPRLLPVTNRTNSTSVGKRRLQLFSSSSKPGPQVGGHEWHHTLPTIKKRSRLVSPRKRKIIES